MMLDDALVQFLQKPLIARLSTIDPDGYPHTVPIWFLEKDGTILFISDRDNRKVKNAQADFHGAVTIGGEPGNGAGYLIRGDLDVIDDPDHAIMFAMVDRYMTGAEATATKDSWKNDDVVVIRLTPRKVSRVH